MSEGEKKATGYGATPTEFKTEIPPDAKLLIPKTPQQIELEKQVEEAKKKAEQDA